MSSIPAWGISTVFPARVIIYMRARFSAAEALLNVDTKAAVEQALDHFTDMLRLCRPDNLGVRDLVPSLLLRLGRDQGCYDFLKRWAVVDSDEDWGDTNLPYLNIRGADLFESVDVFRHESSSLSHLVTLTLLKLRLIFELESFEPEWGWCVPGRRLATPARPVGTFVRSILETLDMEEMPCKIAVSRNQYHELLRVVHDADPHFWDALTDEDNETVTPPPYYSGGLVEEAQLALYQCARAWEETDGAMVTIEADTIPLIPVYRASSAVAGSSGARPGAPEQRTTDTDKRRGVGACFATLFKPSLPTRSRPDLFAAARVGNHGNVRLQRWLPKTGRPSPSSETCCSVLPRGRQRAP
ncbi:hypothetical protein VTK26DRAFT_7787 [Humicola hyalothermophila]